jgi:hypothetical protein
MKSIREAMSTLWRHAQKSLTVKELDNLATATEEAAMMAQNLATTCDHLGALVSEDDGERGGWLSDPQSLAALLWGIAAQADTIGALVTLGNDAQERSNNALGWTIDAQLAARQERGQA